MEIRLIEKAGVPAAEIEAHKCIQKAFDNAAFTKDWFAYASFKLNRGGPGSGDDDFDLVLVTHTHIIAIELKNWRGKRLEARAGSWYVDGEPRGRSPVPLVNLKAKRLGSALQKKVGPGKTPFVYSFVVLGDAIGELAIDSSESASVVRLSQLLTWTQESVYRKYIRGQERFNPLAFRNAYDLFFEGQRGRPQGFTLHGYKPEAQPLWQHPTKLYAEYRAKEKQDPDKLALLRQWDFGALGAELIGEGERGFIGLREQRIYEYVEPRNGELSLSLLRPVARKAESDVTQDFAELYALPPKVTRLSEFVNAALPKMSGAERVVLVKAMLQRFADLHDLNVAHRDVGAHCLWVDRPAKVIISGLPAAYYPAMATVAEFRDRVKVERSNLPEDLGLSTECTPYQRDVYMLGVLSHLILFGERPPKVKEVFSWEKRADDQYGGTYDPVLANALRIDPRERYANAREMLEAINLASTDENEQVIDLNAFESHRAKSKARDYPEVADPLTDDDDLLSYRSSCEGQSVLVKEWHGVEPDLKKPDVAIRLLSFLERARNLKAANLSGLPRIHDYGLSRRSLLVVQEWVDGQTLTQWSAEPQTREARLGVAQGLANTLARLHDFEWSHGDIKPDNVVVRGDGAAVFVDILDFRRSGADAYSAAYLPADYKTMSPMARDRYGLALVIKELLFNPAAGIEVLGLEQVREELERLIGDRNVSALEPLQSALDGKGQSTDAPDLEPFRITLRNLRQSGIEPGEMVSDNGYFYLSMEKSRKSEDLILMHLVGASVRLTLAWSKTEESVDWLTVKRIDLTQLMWAQEKCFGRLPLRLVLTGGAQNEASELGPSLRLWHETFLEELGESTADSMADEATVADDGAALSEDGQASAVASVTDQADFIDVRELWRSLLEAEEDSLPIATVTGEIGRNPQREHQMLVPCVLEGAGFDPDDDDRTWVERQMPDGTWRRCGDLELRDTHLGAKVELAIERWAGKPPKQGDTFRLRSNMESASLNRRSAAVERILDGKSVIPDLIDYFDTGGKQPAPADYGQLPEAVLSGYAQGPKPLNDSQRDAFQKALQFGPISLLQGPPGTGKTWFIASLLHHLVTREGARRVLVVSQAHEAVNNALEKALELFEGKGIAFDAVRLGHESVVSDPIRHLHSSAIEQVYRERFKAEYKERVVRLATEVGLSAEFAGAAVNLHVSLGRLADQIALLELSIANDDAKGEVGREDEGDPAKPAVRLRSLIETFREICGRDYQLDPEDLPFAVILDNLFDALAEEHDVQSPLALSQLRALLKLSDDWLKTLGEPAANFVEFLAKSRTVVAGTLVGIGRRAAGVVQNMYDWVIIDEAGRAAPSELAVALQTGRRILLVGDHKQLPPTFTQEVRDAVKKKLGLVREPMAFMSDFERLFDSSYGKNVGASLRLQYRMAPAIGELVSEVFYRGLLATGRDQTTLEARLLPRQLQHEVSWIDTSTLGKVALESNSPDRVECWNEAEVEVVMGVLKSIVQSKELIAALRKGLHTGEPIIGIICMYSKQRELLNRKKNEARWISPELKKLIKVDTVDSYQGKENKIVILTTVRNNPHQRPGFLQSPNRINVAMSRAMERLIVIGATSMWRGRNQALPLGKVLQKVESMVQEERAAMVRAQEFYA
jgi:serine/threonine protein kinase